VPFNVSPSKLARFFYHDCERQLKAAVGSPEQREQWGMTTPVAEENSVVRLLQDSGYDWEEKVVRELLGGQATIAPGEGPLSERVFPPAESLQKLAEMVEGEWSARPAARREPEDSGNRCQG
jgi:hypothetical protein